MKPGSPKQTLGVQVSQNHILYQTLPCITIIFSPNTKLGLINACFAVAGFVVWSGSYFQEGLPKELKLYYMYSLGMEVSGQAIDDDDPSSAVLHLYFIARMSSLRGDFVVLGLLASKDVDISTVAPILRPKTGSIAVSALMSNGEQQGCQLCEGTLRCLVITMSGFRYPKNTNCWS